MKEKNPSISIKDLVNYQPAVERTYLPPVEDIVRASSLDERRPNRFRRFLRDGLRAGIVAIPVITGGASSAVNLVEDAPQATSVNRIEYFKLTAETLLDTNGNERADEKDARLDMPVQAWIDQDEDWKLGGDEGVVESYTPDGDGQEVIDFPATVDLGGWPVCAEATIGANQNLEPVPGGSTGGGTGKGCAEFNPKTNDANIQLLFRHPSTPTPASTPSPTPAPTASSSIEPPSFETPILTPAVVPLTGGEPKSPNNLLTVTNGSILGGLIATISGLGIIKRLARK